MRGPDPDSIGDYRLRRYTAQVSDEGQFECRQLIGWLGVRKDGVFLTDNVDYLRSGTTVTLREYSPDNHVTFEEILCPGFPE